MTTPLKASRFNIRRSEAAGPSPQSAMPLRASGAAAGPAAARPAMAAPAPGPARKPAPPLDDMPFATHDDGFGDQVFPGAAKAAPVASAGGGQGATAAPAASVEEVLEAIRKEGLTGRQLRIARRLAQRHNLPATSDYDAVRLLREAGIDPFNRSSMLELVSAEPEAEAGGGGAALPPPSTGRALTALPGDGVKLPQTVKPIQVPSTEQRAEVNHAAEILKMQQEIAKRRKKKLMLLGARLFVFVGLPTLLAAWYFSFIATPLYSTKSQFVIQTAEPPSASGMGGLFGGTALANQQDSIIVQGYLQSEAAMRRLDEDVGFRATFEAPAIDPLLRLPVDATQAAAYKLYARYVLISYDQTEGIIRMEVVSPDPEKSAEWSKKLISYAEEQVDGLSKRKREDTMAGAQKNYEEAEQAVEDAQRRVIELQEKFKVLSSDVEIGLLTTQIGQLETQLTQERLNLAQMEANANPNQARMEPVKRRIATLEDQIAQLRAKLTEGQNGGESLARIQGELLVAQSDVQTRQLLLAEALKAMENSRIEANRQVRYLEVSANPVPPDSPSYPRAFENTLVTMLILLGIYLMISMTLSILREQVSA